MKIGRSGIAAVLQSLADKPEFVIEKQREFEQALALYRAGHANFSDCLISVSARAAGCAKTVTFDRVAARDAGMELIQ